MKAQHTEQLSAPVSSISSDNTQAYHIHPQIWGVRGTVVARWTAGQQVEKSILH